jgi:hypothetical protein
MHCGNARRPGGADVSAFTQGDDMVGAPRRIDPISLSATPFCQGEPSANICDDSLSRDRANTITSFKRLESATPALPQPSDRILADPAKSLMLNGGRCRDRTCDPIHVKDVLSR